MYRTADIICKVLIFAKFARNHELANFILIYVSTNNNRLFYVAVTQFENLIIANITSRWEI